MNVRLQANKAYNYIRGIVNREALARYYGAARTAAVENARPLAYGGLIGAAAGGAAGAWLDDDNRLAGFSMGALGGGLLGAAGVLGYRMRGYL